MDVLHTQEQQIQVQQDVLWNGLDHTIINSFAGSSFSDRHVMYRYISDVINEGKILTESQKSYELQKTQLSQLLTDIERQERQMLLEPGTLWYDKMQKA